MSTEEPFDPPKTTDVSIVWIALAIVAVALVAGIFAGKKLVGNTLRALEKEAVPAAQNYLKVLQSGESTAEFLSAPETRRDFDEKEFSERLSKQVGQIVRSRAIDAKVGDGEPPSIVVTLLVQDEKKRETQITIALLTVQKKMLVKNAVLGR